MERITRAIRRLFDPGPSGPGIEEPTLLHPSTEWESPSDYARFSLSLVRHPPEPPYTGGRVDRTAEVVPFLHRLLDFEPSECMGALFLTAGRHPIGHAIPFRGTLTACRVEPRPLLLMAMLANAAKMVVFHQHPSGDPSPSREDRSFARRLEEAGDVVGVGLWDFVILGEPPAYWSLRGGSRAVHRPVLPEPAPWKPRKRRKRKPKYRHPDDSELTWVGTGHMPVWLREEIEGGASLEDFLVDGAEVTPGPARQARKIRGQAVQSVAAES